MSIAEHPGAPEKHNYVTDGDVSLSNSIDTSSGENHLITDNPKEDRLLTTKLDFKVIPILSLLYLICFLDRTNIANARIAGMEKGLDMRKHGYNTALWIFYLPFVLAEIPLNMMLTLSRIKPNIFLGVQTLLLGLYFSIAVIGSILIFPSQVYSQCVKASLNHIRDFLRFDS